MAITSLDLNKDTDAPKQKLRDRIKINKWLMSLLVAIPLGCF